MTDVGHDLVIREAIETNLYRRGDEDVWQTLLMGERVEQTYSVLAEMLNQVNSELAARTAAHNAEPQDRESRREFQEWRRRAIRFKQAVEFRLSIAKTARLAIRVAKSESDNYALSHLHRHLLLTLATAVREHELAMGDLEAEPYDQALWSQLDTLLIPHGDHAVPLRQVVAP